MFRICGRTLDERGEVVKFEIARCAFEERNKAVSYLNTLTRLLCPYAGYEAEQDYWWVRNKDVVTRYTIQS
jgi:hypothetical protein